MSWDYRIVRRQYTHPDGFVEFTFHIHECHYPEHQCPEAGTCEVESNGWTIEPVTPSGDNPEELRADLDRMMGAFDKPVIIDK